MGHTFHSSLPNRDPIAPSCLPSGVGAGPLLLARAESSGLGRSDHSFMQEATHHTCSQEVGAKTGKGSDKALFSEGSLLTSPGALRTAPRASTTSSQSSS